MSIKFNERKNVDLSKVAEKILAKWDKDKTFQKSIETKDQNNSFVFYEGPPSSNGLPGIHHVMARTIKDVFCRYKTLKGYRVNRKAGWDTHGLPVELGVEKTLGITKEDIGKKLSVEEYNNACKKAVMKYTDVWNDLTHKMGYWVDTENPYITYENKYIESVWWLLSQAYKKDLIYKGYTIQPYSPKAGTGLSSHELNQPGCYKMVKDTSVVAQFSLCIDSDNLLFKDEKEVMILAWTTTPWTLPSNTALAINSKIKYVLVKTFNQYTFKPITVVVALKLIDAVFGGGYFEDENLPFDKENKKIPYKIIKEIDGKELVGLKYHQLMPFALPHEKPENAFKIIHADFVSVDDGTGIVHIAPTFGADDAKAALNNNIPGLLVLDENDQLVPLVNLKGCFRKEMGEFAGKYVKNEFYKPDEVPEKSVDVELAILLKKENKAFRVEKYEHSYPHCWRTDKPILYYPLDSWFIKVSSFKDKMVKLNESINWKPKSTGTGRFGNWLENANDWNLSRSRFWGIPIPIWRTEDGKKAICISSIEELKSAIETSVKKGVMKNNPLNCFKVNDFSKENYDTIDLHRHFVDDIILSSDLGEPMYREQDLIDVWFDSGSMPYAQWHYPFENKDAVEGGSCFPADFIAEGVDQTRGWFYTLHAISTFAFDSVAYKNVVSNGLVLDKNGQKMSKRLGNAIDPFETLKTFGADATRWYMITNAQPWDNLKFNLEGINEVKRKFFGTLQNTYSFFSLYANLDDFDYKNSFIDVKFRPEIDRWIISKLNSLISNVDKCYSDYEPTKAGRLIQAFAVDDLSNWYVRLCRKRFWKGEINDDKLAAYQTLYTCLKTISLLSSPIAPFYCDLLYNDLIKSNNDDDFSVHLADFPTVNTKHIDIALEKKMGLGQEITSLILSLRKKEKLKVRQPLSKVLIPSLGEEFDVDVSAIKALVLNEVNVKDLAILEANNNLLKKQAKPNFKTIGPKYGKHMKEIAKKISNWKELEINQYEKNKAYSFIVNEEEIFLNDDDVNIITSDIPGWKIASSGDITVALDVNINKELREEGVARDFVNKVQNLRKDLDLNITDNIEIKISSDSDFKAAINNNLNYICSETLTKDIIFVNKLENAYSVEENKDSALFSIVKI
ncbi:MAG: isoleucine--tRNA ligase [Crocinitomicaceae bacterium]|nr:isoleucine--tRNA ligase [Crocinitomicaceae bacterium]